MVRISVFLRKELRDVLVCPPSAWKLRHLEVTCQGAAHMRKEQIRHAFNLSFLPRRFERLAFLVFSVRCGRVKVRFSCAVFWLGVGRSLGWRSRADRALRRSADCYPKHRRSIGVAVDGSGNVYIADGNSTVYKETPSAGGYAQSIVANSGLNEPKDCCGWQRQRLFCRWRH